ncbi:hypothetical protein CHELA40_15249 [Chelatococcus asaccharovorans]|nr:hypothetical protein CHELA17_60369 [Chelatococcus asaccharovorans]CAH1681949.1 hypothetical protein CHELA40_15249 [Chelatococcus asaccharovorans]
MRFRINRDSAPSAVMAGLVIEVGLARLQCVQRGTRQQPSSVAIPIYRSAIPIGITGTSPVMTAVTLAANLECRFSLSPSPLP